MTIYTQLLFYFFQKISSDYIKSQMLNTYLKQHCFFLLNEYFNENTHTILGKDYIYSHG